MLNGHITGSSLVRFADTSKLQGSDCAIEVARILSSYVDPPKALCISQFVQELVGVANQLKTIWLTKQLLWGIGNALDDLIVANFAIPDNEVKLQNCSKQERTQLIYKYIAANREAFHPCGNTFICVD